MDELEREFGIKEELGWRGLFTRQEAHGAWLNGSRVIKVVSEKGDGHQNGSEGRVLGSIRTPETGIGYFIEWDDTPKVAVFTMQIKLGKL